MKMDGFKGKIIFMNWWLSIATATADHVLYNNGDLANKYISTK